MLSPCMSFTMHGSSFLCKGSGAFFLKSEHPDGVFLVVCTYDEERVAPFMFNVFDGQSIKFTFLK